jgi:hypothetical protein
MPVSFVPRASFLVSLPSPAENIPLRPGVIRIPDERVAPGQVQIHRGLAHWVSLNHDGAFRQLPAEPLA